MTAGGISDPFFSAGDIMREIAELKRWRTQIENEKRLEKASIGAGGLTVKGGKIEILDAAGNVTMTLATDGLTLNGLLEVFGGDISLSGGGSLKVADGGDIEVAGGDVNLDQDGSFRVHDADGEVVVQAGLLPSGDHGLAAVNPADGSLVDLATLAFGMRSDHIAAEETTTSATFTDLATVGPTISDVPIGSTRRCLVLISTQIQIVAENEQAERGDVAVEVSGASSIAPDDTKTSSAFLGAGATTQLVSVSSSATSMILLDASDGLNEGLNTFRLKYRSAFGGEVILKDRKVFVLPF